MEMIYKDDAVAVVHGVMLTLMDVSEDEEPMSEQDRLLLTANKAICTRLKELPSVVQTRLENAIAGKSAEEVYEILYKLMFDYARGYTDSRAAIIEWLKGEQDEAD